MMMKKDSTLPRDPSNSKTTPSTSASFKMACEMEEANRYGRISPSTKAIGSMTRPMDGEGSSTPTVTSTRETGRTIKLMGEVSTSTRMDQAILDNGSKMFSMGTGSKSGMTDRPMKGKKVPYIQELLGRTQKREGKIHLEKRLLL